MGSLTIRNDFSSRGALPVVAIPFFLPRRCFLPTDFHGSVSRSRPSKLHRTQFRAVTCRVLQQFPFPMPLTHYDCYNNAELPSVNPSAASARRWCDIHWISPDPAPQSVEHVPGYLMQGGGLIVMFRGVRGHVRPRPMLEQSPQIE